MRRREPEKDERTRQMLDIIDAELLTEQAFCERSLP